MATFDKPTGYPVKALSSAVKNSQKKKPPTNNDDSDFDDDSSDGGKKNKIIQKVDPKKFVIINPPLHNTEKTNVNEARTQSQIDYLIRLGLGDMDRLTYYRQVFTNPQKANQTPYLRKYVAETLDLVLDIIFSDAQTYNRVRTKLQANLPQGGVRAGITKIEDALVVKAYKSGIEYDILKEVYARGLPDGQESAFNRVNSFIAGGKARRMDADLMEPKPPGEVGTDELTKRYADMTPGQNFALIKKALKGKR
jgi:hypothetical protein